MDHDAGGDPPVHVGGTKRPWGEVAGVSGKAGTARSSRAQRGPRAGTPPCGLARVISCSTISGTTQGLRCKLAMVAQLASGRDWTAFPRCVSNAHAQTRGPLADSRPAGGPLRSLAWLATAGHGLVGRSRRLRGLRCCPCGVADPAALAAVLADRRIDAGAAADVCRQLAAMATSDDARAAISAAGCIPPLVAALAAHGSNEAAVEAACRALSKLCLAPEVAAQVIAAGGIAPAVAALATHARSSDVAEVACWTLAHLAACDAAAVSAARSVRALSGFS